MFGRALRRRCPRCGGRDIFKNYFNMKKHCPRCGLALDRGESEDYWLGAYAINLVVGETAAVVGTMIYIFATWPGTPFAVWVGIALAVFMPVVFYLFSRTLWLAWDLSFRPTEPGDDLRKI
jgi:uncharacterized protein (DUF983 family)